jgi:hypothetical protein
VSPPRARTPPRPLEGRGARLAERETGADLDQADHDRGEADERTRPIRTASAAVFVGVDPAARVESVSWGLMADRLAATDTWTASPE